MRLLYPISPSKTCSLPFRQFFLSFDADSLLLTPIPRSEHAATSVWHSAPRLMCELVLSLHIMHMTASDAPLTVSGMSSSSVSFIRLPLISNLSSIRNTSPFPLPPSIPSPALPSGPFTVLLLASLPLVSGSLLMSVATKRSQSQSSSTTSLAGFSTPGQYIFPFPFFFPVILPRGAVALIAHFVCQSGGSIPLLADNAWQAPCIDCAYDPGPGLCPTHPFTAWPPST